MGQALYRKYRSKSLAEIVGQEHITTTLSNALKKGSISHAYLLTGPRGVGKTSIARILAHEVNQLPYDDDTTHLDIIEIDAASNRRIDEIRELRERVHAAPTSGKYKVYIIDEVHMLTKEAFNALLKTLEEPPEHVIFILATTEAHKLPETIVSRTQRFTFKPIDRQQVIDHLRSIAAEEKIDIDDAALGLIAEHGGGSFRDSISLLDQASNTGSKITLPDVQRILGIAPQAALDQLTAALADASVGTIVSTLHELRVQGYQSAQLARQLAARLRSLLISGDGPFTPTQLTAGLRLLLEVPASHDADTALEIALIDVAYGNQPTETAPPKTPTAAPKIHTAAPKIHTSSDTTPKTVAKPKLEPKPAEQTAEPSKPKAQESKVEVVKAEVVADIAIEEPADTPQEAALVTLETMDNATWNQIVDAVKRQHNTLYAVVRTATPAIDGDTLVLKFQFPFHQKKINDARNKQLVADVVKDVTGSALSISCVVDATDRPRPVSDDGEAVTTVRTANATPPPGLEAISNIFGGAEVIES